MSLRAEAHMALQPTTDKVQENDFAHYVTPSTEAIYHLLYRLSKFYNKVFKRIYEPTKREIAGRNLPGTA